MGVRRMAAMVAAALLIDSCKDRSQEQAAAQAQVEADGRRKLAQDDCVLAKVKGGMSPDQAKTDCAGAQAAPAATPQCKCTPGDPLCSCSPPPAQAKAITKEQARGLPTKLKKMIYAQAGRDLPSGRATPVLDLITGEIGQPTGTYPDSVSVWYVWGAQLGTSPSTDGIKGAPFSVRTRQGLACGDYAPNMVEFWATGERVWPD